MTAETDLFAVPVIRDTVDLEEWRDACVSSATAPLQAEIEALRAEVERLGWWVEEWKESFQKAAERAERLAEALREARPFIGRTGSYPELHAKIDALLREEEEGRG